MKRSWSICRPLFIARGERACLNIAAATSVRRVAQFVLAILLFSGSQPLFGAGRLDPTVNQLVIGIAPDWDSMTGKLQRMQKTPEGWTRVGTPMGVLFGKHGLAWGRGELAAAGDGGPVKVEKDNRAPAGVFKIGLIYTYDQSLPAGADYPFHTVTAADAWVDDLNSPFYNEHVTVDPKNPPPWYHKARMRLGDFAYRWLVEIRHNADPPVPGFGSAIFFHIRRGPTRPSAGCTTMAEPDLVRVITWLRAPDQPQYVCLPRAEYLARWQAWGLPDPATTGLL
jgi:L,D-peptidoglycan transpeptidase YkuD (ErfK/YbiS/YcfS/YnhG family)